MIHFHSYAKSLNKDGICNCIKSSLPANKPTKSNNIKKDFNLSDAREALRYIYNTYGRDMAIIIEKMFRGETAHFASVQYKKCGTCGMEAHGAAPYYGWDSNFFEKYLEYKPVGIYEMYESKGLSGKGGNAQDTRSAWSRISCRTQRRPPIPRQGTSQKLL